MPEAAEGWGGWGETLVDGQHPSAASPTCRLFDLKGLVIFVCGAGVSRMLISYHRATSPGLMIFCSVVLSELSPELRVLRVLRTCAAITLHRKPAFLTSAPLNNDYCQPF